MAFAPRSRFYRRQHTGKKSKLIELLELNRTGIHVAEYLATLPPPELLPLHLDELVAKTRHKRTQANIDSRFDSQEPKTKKVLDLQGLF
jgi:hypothetical protein